jgi:hypothetical protein
LKAILSIPASLLTFKVEQISAQQGLTDAQAKLIESQIDLIRMQGELQAAQAGEVCRRRMMLPSIHRGLLGFSGSRGEDSGSEATDSPARRDAPYRLHLALPRRRESIPVFA